MQKEFFRHLRMRICTSLYRDACYSVDAAEGYADIFCISFFSVTFSLVFCGMLFLLLLFVLLIDFLCVAD